VAASGSGKTGGSTKRNSVPDSPPRRTSAPHEILAGSPVNNKAAGDGRPGSPRWAGPREPVHVGDEFPSVCVSICAGRRKRSAPLLVLITTSRLAAADGAHLRELRTDARVPDERRWTPRCRNRKNELIDSSRSPPGRRPLRERPGRGVRDTAPVVAAGPRDGLRTK